MSRAGVLWPVGWLMDRWKVLGGVVAAVVVFTAVASMGAASRTIDRDEYQTAMAATNAAALDAMADDDYDAATVHVALADLVAALDDMPVPITARPMHRRLRAAYRNELAPMPDVATLIRALQEHGSGGLLDHGDETAQAATTLDGGISALRQLQSIQRGFAAAGYIVPTLADPPR